MVDRAYPYKDICDALSSNSEEKAIHLVRTHGWGSGNESVLMWLGARTTISANWFQVIRDVPPENDFLNHPYFWGLTCSAGDDQRADWLEASLSLMTPQQITDPMVMQAAANTGQSGDLGLIDARAAELNVSMPWSTRKYLYLAGALRSGNLDVVSALLDRVGEVDVQTLGSILKSAGGKTGQKGKNSAKTQMDFYLTAVDQKILRDVAGTKTSGVNRLM